jgi:hypothetical protein
MKRKQRRGYNKGRLEKDWMEIGTKGSQGTPTSLSIVKANLKGAEGPWIVLSVPSRYRGPILFGE